LVDTSSQKLWTRDFAVLFLASFLTWGSFHFLLPTLPAYMTQVLGASPAQIALVLSMLTVSAVLSRPLAGFALDRFGRRWVAITCAALFVLAALSYNLAATLPLLALIRVLHGLPFGGATTSYDTVAADLVPPQRWGEGLGIYGTASTLAMAVGPAVALGIVGQGQYTRLFSAAALAALGALVLASALRYPTVRNSEAVLSRSSVLEPRVAWLAVAAILALPGYGGVVTFVTLYASELGVERAGLFFAVYAASVLLSRVVAGRLFDRYGPRPSVATSLACLAASFMALGLWRTELGYFAAALLLGPGMGMLFPSLGAMAVNLVPAARRGAANATVGVAIDVGIGGGANVMGYLAQALGSYAAMYVAAALGMVLPGLLFFLKVIPQYDRSTKQGEKETARLAE
jgi:MFS family permease